MASGKIIIMKKDPKYWQLINNPSKWDIQSFLQNNEKETGWIKND